MTRGKQLLRGFVFLLILFAIFLLMPICLTVLPKLYEFVSESVRTTWAATQPFSAATCVLS